MTDAKLDALALKFQSVTPGTPLADREQAHLYNTILEILVRRCHICMQNETEAAACADAIKSVLKNYSPDKGKFLPYFRKTYPYRKINFYNKQNYRKCHIRTKRRDIPACDAPQDGAKPLLLLRPGYEYYVYSALPEYKNPEYFKLRLHVPGDTQKTRTVYVKYTSDVEVYFYNEFLNIYEDADGNEIERGVEDKREGANPEDQLITREMIQWALQLNLLVFLKFHEQKMLDTKVLTRPGKLTQYDCLRMFFTEDMIAILHSTAESFGEETTDRETMSMDLCDRGWLTFLLTEPCSSFREISVTPVNTYDHFLHNGREKPVKLPPVLSIRGKYIREGMGVNRTDYSLKSEISKIHKEYENRMNEGRR